MSRTLFAALMRNISQLMASLMLLATQANTPFVGHAASVEASAKTESVYEVSLQTNTPLGVEVVGPKQPNYDTEVLAPLHVAQAAAAERQRTLVAAENAARVVADSQPNIVVAQAPILISGNHSDWMLAAGIAPSDFGYVDYIIDHESGWGVTKSNYGGSGAYGLGQAMPASKMAKFGSDYLTSPITQLKWASAYAKGSYGSWSGAYSHWLSHHSW